MKKRILLIEKDTGIKEIISEILVMEGFRVSAVSSTDNIIRKISEFKPHVILIDIIWPQSEEVEVCKKIKASNLSKDIPVIVLSTSLYITENIRTVCADDAIDKPFDIDALLNAIRRQVAA